MNLYNILEVNKNASADDIKKAYRKLSLKYHPDRNNNNPECCSKFQQINEAYEVLSVPEKKYEYDMSLNNPFLNNIKVYTNDFTNNPLEDLITSFFSNNFNNDINNNIQFSTPNIRIFKTNMDTTNINDMFFNKKPDDVIKNITIDIQIVLTGSKLPIEIERYIINMNNKTYETETIYINIPKGIDDGEIIILKNKGNICNNIKGDLKVYIKIENNTDFIRNGLDLIFIKKITLKEALCGFTFEFKYLTNKIYTINNNGDTIISPNFQKKIPNMGLTRDNYTGNLIITFEIIFPEKIKKETIEILRNLEL